jgi:dienelactone hydrolase
MNKAGTVMRRDVRVASGPAELDGILRLPKQPLGLVLFAHGSGSSRLSKRNSFVADELASAGLASLLFDLLTHDEEGIDQYSREFRFNIDLLTARLLGATKWVRQLDETKSLALGYFGASTGAAAALRAAARLGESIKAVTSRGGRPDLAESQLARVGAPTLLIVGGEDTAVLQLNRQAHEKLTATKELAIVAGATHLFDEPGTLEQVAQLATRWFKSYLSPPDAASYSLRRSASQSTSGARRART